MGDLRCLRMLFQLIRRTSFIFSKLTQVWHNETMNTTLKRRAWEKNIRNKTIKTCTFLTTKWSFVHLPARFKRKRASSSYERLWTQKEVLARTLFLGCAVCKQFSSDDMLIEFPCNYASRLFLSPSQLNGKKFENLNLKNRFWYHQNMFQSTYQTWQLSDFSNLKIEFTLISLFLPVDILAVSPSMGSTAGGTVLTIKGKGFDELSTKVSVKVAGNTCRAVFIWVSKGNWFCTFYAARLA